VKQAGSVLSSGIGSVLESSSEEYLGVYLKVFLTVF